MIKFNVYGWVPVGIVMTVEAEDEESAIAAAYRNFGGLTNYAGNGGTDKICGTGAEDTSIDASDCEPEFTEAVKADGEGVCDV